MAKHAGGRPKEYTPEKIAEIIDQLNKYIDETECPIIADFAYKHNIRRQSLYDFKEFSDTLRKMIDKKESVLFFKGLSGDYNSQIVKLGLAQLGYTDKVDNSISTIDGDGKPTGFNFVDVPKKK